MAEKLNTFFENKRNRILFSIVLNLILFALVFAMHPSRFDTNDDYRMRLILSGEYTGSPSADAVFLTPLFSWMLSGLYSLTRSVPWYGIFMMGNLLIACSYILCHLLNQNSKGRRLAGMGGYLLFFLFFVLKQLILPTFTLIAAFMELAGLIAFYQFCSVLSAQKAEKNSSRKTILWKFLPFVYFLISGYFIRTQVLLIAAPAYVFIGLVFFLQNLKITKKAGLSLAAALIVILGGAFLITESPKINKDYAQFRSYTKARSNLYDYDDIPAYEGNEEFYDSVGVDSQLVGVIQSRTLDVDPVLGQETYQAVADYAKSAAWPGMKQKIKDSFLLPIFFVAQHRTLLAPMMALISVSLLFLMFLKGTDSSSRLYGLGAIGFIILVPVLLQFRGRIMDRVIETVYLMGIGLIWCALQSENLSLKSPGMNRKRIQSVFELVMAAVILAVSTGSSALILKDGIKEKYDSIELATNRLGVLENFARRNPENFYFYNALDFIGASSKTWSASSSQVLNMDSLGNWNMKSPNYYLRNSKYGFASAIQGLTESEHVYYAQIGNKETALQKLLDTKYGLKLELHASLSNPYGDPICIYQAQPKDE